MNTQQMSSFYADEMQIAEVQRNFIVRSYMWMMIGLLVTGVTMFSVFLTGFYEVLFSSRIIIYAAIFGEFALVAWLSARISTMSPNTARGAFLGYSLLSGITLSVIGLAYEPESIALTFLIASGMFGGLSAFGLMTKRSLSGLSTFLMTGLFGIIIATVVNMFLNAPALYFAISVGGVLLFAGLTAYDTQKLKELALEVPSDASGDRFAVYGGLTLYLDFINLFLFLLRLFGGRRDD